MAVAISSCHVSTALCQIFTYVLLASYYIMLHIPNVNILVLDYAIVVISIFCLLYYITNMYKIFHESYGQKS